MPAPWFTKTRSKLAAVSLQAWVSIAIFCVRQTACMKWHEWNHSLQVSRGPSIAFELRRVTRTESEYKHLLISCHVTRLKAANWTLSDGSPSSNFGKNAILGPAPIDGLVSTTVKSVRSSLLSSEVDTEIWTFVYIWKWSTFVCISDGIALKHTWIVSVRNHL